MAAAATTALTLSVVVDAAMIARRWHAPPSSSQITTIEGEMNDSRSGMAKATS